jgi:transposase
MKTQPLSAATERALRRVARGSTAYAAAKKEGIALSTIYRAQRRIRERVAAAAARLET